MVVEIFDIAIASVKISFPNMFYLLNIQSKLIHTTSIKEKAK
jgi:hypothetical protein